MRAHLSGIVPASTLRSRSWGLAALAFFATGGWAAGAEASPTFPARIQQTLEMACAPPCTLCHRDQQGGFGTVVQPFGSEMLASGLGARDPDFIPTALAELESSGVDSDGDGTGDVEQLRQGENPNGGAALCGPTYGCFATVASAREFTANPFPSCTAIVLVLVLAARRGRRGQG